MGGGLEIESSLTSTSEEFDHLAYYHGDSINGYTFDSTGIRYGGKKSYGSSGPTPYLAIQFGFVAKLHSNFYLSGNMEFKYFRMNSILSLMENGLIFSYKFGLYYRIPSKDKPQPLPG